MGISPNAKFSKAEWGLIRRKVRKKPRRFTSRFIRQQFQELKDYRKYSRSIHKGEELDDASSHKFDGQGMLPTSFVLPFESKIFVCYTCIYLHCRLYQFLDQSR